MLKIARKIKQIEAQRMAVLIEISLASASTAAVSRHMYLYLTFSQSVSYKVHLLIHGGI